MRKPYFRKALQAWYIHLNGRDIRLGTARDDAFQKYHALMAGQQEASFTTPAAEIIDAFVTWCEKHRTPNTVKLYKFFLDRFKNYIGNTRLADLKPTHVAQWIDAQGFQANTANAAIRAVLRAFNWAAKMGVIKSNPVRGVERPAPTPRECYLTSRQWEKLLTQVADEEFRDFLIILHETGCRPQEACTVEAGHFDRTGRTWVFPRAKSKGKKHPRVVVLNDTAYSICRKLALKHPTGPLFRNRAGRPWNKNNLNSRFRHLSKKLGFHVHAYALRHTWITNALLRGVDPLTVATLAGHVNINMIWSVYNKIRFQQDHLQKAVAQATAETKLA